MGYFLAVVMFGVVIFVHELGHFLMARIFNMDVVSFSLGFGPKLFSYKRGKTEYAISAIPLGGYVKLVEMEEEKNMKGYSSFERHPWYQKFIMSVMGATFNAIFAFLLFWILLTAQGEIDYMPVVGNVIKSSPAEKSGMLKGDTILSINGENIKYWSDLSRKIKLSGGEKLRIKILRGQKELSLQVKPEQKEIGEKKLKRKLWVIGILPDESKIVYINYGVIRGFLETFVFLGNFIYNYVGQLKYLFSPEGYKELGGPLTIGYIAKKSYEESGFFSFLRLSAIISLLIGFFNLFPIPPLDGFLGIVYLMEGVTNKRPGKKVKFAIQLVGIIFIVGIFTIAFYNDILRLMGKL